MNEVFKFELLKAQYEDRLICIRGTRLSVNEVLASDKSSHNILQQQRLISLCASSQSDLRTASKDMFFVRMTNTQIRIRGVDNQICVFSDGT